MPFAAGRVEEVGAEVAVGKQHGHRTGEHRRATYADLLEGLRLADALPNIDFVMSMFLPADVDQTLADRYQVSGVPHTVINDGAGNVVGAVPEADLAAAIREALQ